MAGSGLTLHRSFNSPESNFKIFGSSSPINSIDESVYRKESPFDFALFTKQVKKSATKTKGAAFDAKSILKIEHIATDTPKRKNNKLIKKSCNATFNKSKNRKNSNKNNSDSNSSYDTTSGSENKSDNSNIVIYTGNSKHYDCYSYRKNTKTDNLSDNKHNTNCSNNCKTNYKQSIESHSSKMKSTARNISSTGGFSSDCTNSYLGQSDSNNSSTILYNSANRNKNNFNGNNNEHYQGGQTHQHRAYVRVAVLHENVDVVDKNSSSPNAFSNKKYQNFASKKEHNVRMIEINSSTLKIHTNNKNRNRTSSSFSKDNKVHNTITNNSNHMINSHNNSPNSKTRQISGNPRFAGYAAAPDPILLPQPPKDWLMQSNNRKFSSSSTSKRDEGICSSENDTTSTDSLVKQKFYANKHGKSTANAENFTIQVKNTASINPTFKYKIENEQKNCKNAVKSKQTATSSKILFADFSSNDF